MTTQPITTTTRDHLKVKFHGLWLRGSGWQLEIGEVLYQIKEVLHEDHGAWGDFLSEYDLARSTADDYIRRYKEKAGITETREFVQEPEPDAEADERETDIVAEQAKRAGKTRTHNLTQIRPFIKNLCPDHTVLYWEEYKENRQRCDDIWREAFLKIIGAEQVCPSSDPERESAEEVAVCSAS